MSNLSDIYVSLTEAKIPLNRVVDINVLPAYDGEVYFRYVNWNDQHLYCEHYPVVRYTPKGVWLRLFNDTEKFVLTDPLGRRFAYADKRNALKSFIKRKEWQLIHLQKQRRYAAVMLAFAKQLQSEIK